MAQIDKDSRRYLKAMDDGIRAQSNLLAAVLPRLAPEPVVVACAVEGLGRAGIEDIEVVLEGPIEQVKRLRCDLTVRPLGKAPFYFEFKTLWPGGLTEYVAGAKVDATKLAAVAQGFLVAFAYILTEAPESTNRRLARPGVTLDDTLAKASAALGREEPCFKGERFEVDSFRTRGAAQLIAWRLP